MGGFSLKRTLDENNIFKGFEGGIFYGSINKFPDKISGTASRGTAWARKGHESSSGV